ncbi:MAG: iron-containing alcohol dehydrogenase, partial [Anaerolineae bacterium]
LALIDPSFTANLPAQVTADTGIDVLTHAVEAFSSTWNNDFSDGLALQSAQLVFTYLPRAYRNGADDMEARTHMANAATLGGLAINNSHIALAHALGHSAGALFGIPHGRVTGLLLPYTIEYTARGGAGRYIGLARLLGLPHENEESAGMALAAAIRALLESLGQPLTLQQAGVSQAMLEERLADLCDRAEMDPSLVTSRRIPVREELEALYRTAFDGQPA